MSARGFNATSANKLLVMVDGRIEYSPLFSGVFWNMLDYTLEDIDRIEVIRGPGATLWGANAVNGVVNIVTRHSRDTQGTLLSFGTGNEDPALADFRYGGAAAGRDLSRSTASSRGGVRRSSTTACPSDDGRRRGQIGFRIDRPGGGGEWLFKGDVFRSEDDLRGSPVRQVRRGGAAGRMVADTSPLARTWLSAATTAANSATCRCSSRTRSIRWISISSTDSPGASGTG